MSGNDRDLTITLAALKSRGCHVNRDWLSDCINFFRSENPNCSPKDLENFVFDQWLLGDLREIASCGSLPPNLNNILKTMLQGKMACQIESFTDIGHSAYNQMQKVRDDDVAGNSQVDENKEFQQSWEPKSNRCLQLTISDGAQTLRAIEYRYIGFLKTDMMPGIKILLCGPIECRRGVLLLEEKHITVLGGEVDALAIVNAYENILARKLNVAENPDPYHMAAPRPTPQTQPQPLPAQPQAQPQQQQRQPQPAPQPNNANRAPQQPLARNTAEARRQQNQPASGRAPAQPKKLVQSSLSWSKQTSRPAQSDPPRTSSMDFDGNDEDFMNIPLDAWDEEMNYESVPTAGNGHASFASKPQENTSVQTSLRSGHIDRSTISASSTADYFDDADDFDEALLLEASLALEKVSKPHSFTKTNSGFHVPVVQKKAVEETVSSKRLASSALSEDSLKKPLFAKRRKETSSQDVTSSTDPMDVEIINDPPETSIKIPISLPSQPFVYLSQISQTKAFSTFRVKAAVITVIEKLSISQNKWKLSAKISDGSANIDVRFSNNVLEELFGMSATTMNEMKKQIAQQPEKKEIIRQKLTKAQCRLINLNCLLDIRMCEEDLPLVVGFEDISSNTVTALIERDPQLKR